MATEEEKDFSSLKRSRSAHLTQLSKLYKELEQNMMSYENVDSVNCLYEKLLNKFQTFKDVHSRCSEKCTNLDIKETLQKNFDDCEENFIEFRDRYSEWTADLEKPPEDDASSVASSFSNSSRSKLKCAKAKRLIAEHKLKTMKQKIDLERAKRELELKQRLIESQSELKQAQIEESVWSEAVNEDQKINIRRDSAENRVVTNTGTGSPESEVTFRRSNTGSGQRRVVQADTGNDQRRAVQVDTGSDQRRDVQADTGRDQHRAVEADGKSAHTLHQTASDCTCTAHSVDQAFQRLATKLQEGFNLPKPEILRFSGSDLEYCKFVSNFETNIESKVSDDRLKLSYLIQYCDGEAKSAIEDCVLLGPNEGYKRAREILYSRYGRPHNIARTYIDKLVHGPPLKASDSDGLSNLALEMKRCEITLSQLGFNSDVDNTENLRRIVKRLPMHVRGKWVDVAHSITEFGREPRFSDLVKFVDEKARIATSMYGLDLAGQSSHGNVVENVTKSGSNALTRKNDAKNFATNSNTPVYIRTCCCCSGKCQDLASCQTFTAMSLNDREQFVRKSKLCFNCLKDKHFVNVCRKPSACTVPECKSKHHILLHSWTTYSPDHTATEASVNCAATNGSFVRNCLGIIPVVVKGEDGSSCTTYALIDDGADKTLCDERLLKKMKLNSKPISYRMSTVSSTSTWHHGKQVDLKVKSMATENEFDLRNVWSVKQLPISTRSAATQEDLRYYPYLADLDIPRVDANDVLLLIRTDSPGVHIPLEVRSGNDNQPYAIRTQLGWIVRGPVHGVAASNVVNVNFQQTSDLVLQQQLERMWNADFGDKIRGEKTALSIKTNGANNAKGLKLMATRTVPYPCPDGEDYFNCKSENVCLDKRLHYDGTRQCEDGTDEDQCTAGDRFIDSVASLVLGTIVTIVVLSVLGSIGLAVIISMFTCSRKQCECCFAGWRRLWDAISSRLGFVCGRCLDPISTRCWDPMCTAFRARVWNPIVARCACGKWSSKVCTEAAVDELVEAICKNEEIDERNDEWLLTFVAEVERILNDRPITQLSSGPNDPPALPPNMLLLLRSDEVLSPGVFSEKDVYARRWWRKVQYLADVFWRRWTREYLAELQPRQKWNREKPNLKIGDVVLVAENNIPRGQWPLGRVTKINLSRDGLVRSCVVKTKMSELTKPITKLGLLESNQ